MLKILTAAAALAFAAPALAEETAPVPATQAAPALEPAAGDASQSAANQGDSAPTQRSACIKDSPWTEYRDCVNASTRDPDAKVRLA